MAKPLRDWIDHRTGYRTLLHALLLLNFPVQRAARWRFIWGGALAFAFLAEVVTGVLLMTVYSPSTASAWGSVYYIQYTLAPWGAFIRGLHHWLSHLMIVLVMIHLTLVVVTAGYRAPKEFIYWSGLALGALVLALAITGNPLPWDQEGYWSYQIETGIAGTMPLVGPWLRSLLVGGVEFGNLTITRLYTLHVVVLPALASVLLAAHVALVRRDRLASQNNGEATEPYWPYQVGRNLIVFFVVLSIAIGLCVVWPDIDARLAGEAPETTQEDFPMRDIALDAPADPGMPYSARPQWYVRFLYELRHRVGKENEIWITAGLPVALGLILFLMPYYARVLPRPLARTLAVILVFGGFSGAAYLTVDGWLADRRDPEYAKVHRRATEYAARALFLTEVQGIPPEGAVVLLQNDVKTQGPLLFAAHCSTCHRWNGHDGTGEPSSDPATASDLSGFGTPEWVRGFLEHPSDAKYFGNTEFKEGAMAEWSAGHLGNATEEELNGVLALLAAPADKISQLTASLDKENPPQPASEHERLLRVGLLAFRDGFAKDQRDFEADVLEGALSCNECHALGPALPPAGEGGGPDLAGYASEQWLRGIITNPGDDRYYGNRNDRMPAFGEQLRDSEIEMLVRWLRGDWRCRSTATGEGGDQ